MADTALLDSLSRMELITALLGTKRHRGGMEDSRGVVVFRLRSGARDQFVVCRNMTVGGASGPVLRRPLPQHPHVSCTLTKGGMRLYTCVCTNVSVGGRVCTYACVRLCLYVRIEVPTHRSVPEGKEVTFSFLT